MPTSRTGTWNSRSGSGGPQAAPGFTSGFTLLELMVVLFIMALMVGMVLPGMNLGAGPTDLARAANRINGAVNEARSRSILSREPRQLVFYKDRVVLMPEGESSSLPGSVVCESVEMAGDDEPSEVFPRVLPFLPRGACAKAAIILEEGRRLTLLVRPFGLDIVERHGKYTLSQLTQANIP